MTTLIDLSYGFPAQLHLTEHPASARPFTATIIFQNPLTNHQLRYVDIDRLLGSVSPNPKRIVQVSSSAQTAELAEAAVRRKADQLKETMSKYYSRILHLAPELGADSAAEIFNLCKDQICSALPGGERTTQRKLQDIAHIILPLMEGIPVGHMSRGDYNSVVKKITHRNVSTMRKQELLRLLRDFVIFLFLHGYCPYAPNEDDASITISRADKMHAYRAKDAQPIALPSEALQQMLAGMEKEPESSLAPLALYLIYDGLSLQDMSLCCFRDLSVAEYGGAYLLTLTVPDTDSSDQPISRVRRVPLSPQSSAWIAHRFRYWSNYLGTQDAAELMPLPLLSSRRKNPRPVSAEHLQDLLAQAMQKYIRNPPLLANGKINVGLLCKDAQYRIRYRIGADAEQAQALLGYAQKTTDGNHYYDLYSDSAMHTVAAKMARSPLTALAVSPEPCTDIGKTAYHTAPGTRGMYHFEIALPAGASILLQSSIGARCTAQLTS